MKKVLLVEKNLVNALEYEKIFKTLGFELVGIGFDYLTAILFSKDYQPDFVFCNPNLMLKGEGIDIVDHLIKKGGCTVFLYNDGTLSKEQIKKYRVKYKDTLILSGLSKDEISKALESYLALD